MGQASGCGFDKQEANYAVNRSAEQTAAMYQAR
jgi:hypothetical protein